MIFAELVVALQLQGKTASSHLQELYSKYGYFQVCLRLVLHNTPSMLFRQEIVISYATILRQWIRFFPGSAIMTERYDL